MRGPILAGSFLLAVLATTGCGPSLKSVKGVVKLDGNPVEGALVSFVSDDGTNIFSGATDASGNFTLANAQNQPGVTPGTYKVTVTKRAGVTGGGEAMMPGSPEYMKQMEKEAKEGAKKSGPGGMMMPGMMKGGPGTLTSGEKSELPNVYSSASTTPITVTVPPPNQPVVIELKSKP